MEYMKEMTNKEIIGDDYPTYEDSVNMTLAEQEREVSNSNLGRLLQENANLKHRLACIADDLEIIENHICRYDKDYIFKKPSLNPDGSTNADEAWHNITNIEIACDLTDDAPLGWGSKKKVDISKNIL
jgi:hypothetical protein